jgi:hypothetical protein
MASPIWGGAYSSLFLGHSAWLIPFVMVGEIRPVRQDGKQGERNLRRPCSYPTCAIRSGKLFLRKRSRFQGLIGFTRRGGTCRLHAIFMNQLFSFGGVRRNCQALVREPKAYIESTIKGRMRRALLFRDVCNLRR